MDLKRRPSGKEQAATRQRGRFARTALSLCARKAHFSVRAATKTTRWSMRGLIFAALGSLALAAAVAGPAAAGGLSEAGELEAARANARAGGPVSARDAELLERWGCLSGTRNAFCERLSHPRRYY